MAEIVIRPETPDDIPAVRALNESAFEGPAEAGLVDALRENGKAVIALVAVDNEEVAGHVVGHIVGHILFSPMTLEGKGDIRAAGLAPMAVAESRRGRGIGSDLVREGLARCREKGFGAVFVLGHPDYYPRFGFKPASGFGIRSEYDVPDDVFMALELEDGALEGVEGTIKYAPEFAGL